MVNGSFEAACAICDFLSNFNIFMGLTAQLFELFPKNFFYRYPLSNLIYVRFDNKLLFWIFVTEYNNI